MPPVVKAAAPQDLLALVPALVGFRPRDSIVLVAFAAKRTCGAFRFDLPRSQSAAVRKRIVTSMIGTFCRLAQADTVVPVVYAEEPAGDPPPAEAIVMALIERAEAAGYRVMDALWVASDGWGSFFEAADDGPRSLELITASAVHEQVRERGMSPAGSIDEQATLPRIGPFQLRAVDEAMEALADDPRTLDLFDPLLAGSEPQAQEELLLSIEKALFWDSENITPDQAALVSLWAQLPWLRDIVLFQWGWGEIGGRATFGLALRHRAQSIRNDEPFATALAGMNAPRPDASRVQRAIALLREVAARAPGITQAPPLTMLAWFHWALGRSSVAGRFVAQARAVDARYGLAELLDRMLSAGMLPEWAFCDDADQGSVEADIH